MWVVALPHLSMDNLAPETQTQGAHGCLGISIGKASSTSDPVQATLSLASLQPRTWPQPCTAATACQPWPCTAESSQPLPVCLARTLLLSPSRDSANIYTESCASQDPSTMDPRPPPSAPGLREASSCPPPSPSPVSTQQPYSEFGCPLMVPRGS